MLKDMIKSVDFQKRNKTLIEFIEKVIFLSRKSEVDFFYNANWHLPNLVENTFEQAYIEEVMEKYK